MKQFLPKILTLLTLVALALNHPVGAQALTPVQTVSLTPTADVTINEYYPTQNFNSQSDLRLGIFYYNNTQYRARSLLKFDLSSIPLGSSIDSAQLSLYINQFTGSLPSGQSINAYRVSNPDWQESSLTWNTRPNWIDPPDAFTGQSANSTYLRADVRNIVELWTSASPLPNYGFYVLSPLFTSNPTNYQYHLGSREDSNSNYRPTLTIYYFPPTNRPSPTPNQNQPLNIYALPSPTSVTAHAFPSDTTPPTVSAAIWTATQTTAEVYWHTNEPATSAVYYGTDNLFSLHTPTDPNLVSNHHVSLTNLSPGTSYPYKAVSADSAGNIGYSFPDTIITIHGQTPPSSNQPNSNSSGGNGGLTSSSFFDPIGNVFTSLGNFFNPPTDNPGSNPNPSATPAGQTSEDTPTQPSTNPISNLAGAITDKIGQMIVEDEVKNDKTLTNKPGQSGAVDTKESSLSAISTTPRNPLLIAAARFGVNRTVGVVLIAISAVFILLALVLFSLSHKAIKHVHGKYFGNSTGPKKK